jgi:hypothetical protein
MWKKFGYQSHGLTYFAKRAEMISRSGGRNTVPQNFVGDSYAGGADNLYALEAVDGRSARRQATGETNVSDPGRVSFRFARPNDTSSSS